MNRKKIHKIKCKEIWRHRELYLMILPAIVVLIIFKYIPMYGVLMAFQDVKIGDSFGQSEWIGLYHFKRFFNGAWCSTIIKNTISVSLLNQIFSIPIPIFLAILLYNCTNAKIKKAAQMATYLPYLLSIALVVSILNLFCSGESGLVNILLKKWGYEGVNFFGDPDLVYPMYVISGIWQGAGYGAIVYLGALSSVDEQVIEAARIDGAGKLQCIWHIQLPTILPTIVTMLILSVGRMFSVGADKMLLLQTDLNISASEIISTYVYKVGLGSAQYGFAAAVGLFENVVNVLVLVTVNAISKKLTDTSIM